MVSTNFRTLPYIEYRLAPKTPGDSGSVRPACDQVGTLADAVELLNETEAMHDEELRRNAAWLPPVLDGFGRHMNFRVCGRGPDSLAGRPVDLPTLMRFKNRETVLISSYVVQWFVFSGIVERAYREVAAWLRHFDPSRAPTQADVDATLTERKQDWPELLRMRHKVFAHTAFGDPRPADGFGVQFTSLVMVTGGDFCIDVTGVTLGISHVHGDDGIAAHFTAGAPAHFAEVSVGTLASAFAPHVARWFSMFEQLLERVAGLSLDEIRQKEGDVEGLRVIRGAEAIRWNRSV